MIFNKIEKIDFFKLYKKFNFLSLIFIILSIIFLVFKGLNFGVDFKGGTFVAVKYSEEINVNEVRNTLGNINIDGQSFDFSTEKL